MKVLIREENGKAIKQCKFFRLLHPKVTSQLPTITMHGRDWAAAGNKHTQLL